MSGAGTAAKPWIGWCWSCSRKLRGNFHRVVIGPDGHRHFVHAECARRDRLVVVEGAHLSREDAEDIWALADARARRAAGEKPIPFEVVRKRLGLRARSR